MRHPQIVVAAPDDWLANQLSQLCADRGWVLRSVRRPVVANNTSPGPAPRVLLVQMDLHATQGQNPAALQQNENLTAIADARRIHPDTAVVAVADTKIADDDRANWTAALLDIGCRLVLFPPLTRTVMEDAVSGLMESLIRNLGRQDGPATGNEEK